jgi:hypothetical protein
VLVVERVVVVAHWQGQTAWDSSSKQLMLFVQYEGSQVAVVVVLLAVMVVFVG